MKNRILITGASSGVGKSLANYFSESMEVYALARRLDLLKKNFSMNKNVKYFKCDLSNVDELNSTLKFIKNSYGPIGNIINNAGNFEKGYLDQITIEIYKKSLDVNFLAPLQIMKFFLPDMESNNFGRVINITSGAPINNIAGYSAYNSSKSALNSLTITIAKEYSEKNIKINLMSPGAVKSDIAPNSIYDPDICHPTADYLINLDENGPTGNFFWLGNQVPIFADLSDTDWLNGIPGKNMKKITI